MDSSPTFQFVVEALQRSWHVIAPDWRGYGASQWLGRAYAFADYADLEAVLTHYAGNAPVWLAAHSMGANIALELGGGAPRTLPASRCLISGLAAPAADASAAAVLARCLCSRATAQAYRDAAAFAERLRTANPRLDANVRFSWRMSSPSICRRRGDGLRPWHRLPSPLLYNVEEWMANWRRVRAPILLLIADEGLCGNSLLRTMRIICAASACFADAWPNCLHPA
jgi:pimeloyl-ACP methyl ester carboxylesterase